MSEKKALETVEIEGERSQMELKLDKRVFNVGTDLNSSSGVSSVSCDHSRPFRGDTPAGAGANSSNWMSTRWTCWVNPE